MAAPHVSGVASLLVEDVGRRPGRIKTIIQRTADDLGKKGNDPYYGKGRLNAASAVGAN
jgi:subtilisin family serine protease